MAADMKVNLIGDVMLGRVVNDTLTTASPGELWGDVLPLLHSADVLCCNLECVLTNTTQPWGSLPGQAWKAFHFRGDPERVEELQTAGVTAVSLANNHVLDYQATGLLEMLDLLDANRLVHAGAGRTLDNACRPGLWTCGGLRCGMLAFTDNEPQWEALEDRAGVYYVPVDEVDERIENLLARVRQLRKGVDLLIVSTHWGGNAGYHPPESHCRLASQLIGAGADLVFGHSSHVFRGIEIREGVPVLYGTGDFVDDYAVDLIERNDESMVFQLEYSEAMKLQSIRLFPAWIGECRTHRAHGRQAQRIAWRMMELCEEMGTRMEWDDVTDCLYFDVASANANRHFGLTKK